MPCCCPPTAIASTLFEHARLASPSRKPSPGSAETSVPGGWGARDAQDLPAGLGVADGDLHRLGRGVDPGHDAQVRCSLNSCPPGSEGSDAAVWAFVRCALCDNATGLGRLVDDDHVEPPLENGAQASAAGRPETST